MHRSAAAVALLVAAGAVAQTAGPPRYEEAIEVSLVNLDVVVRDRDGKPVRGLTAADFEVRENGKVQEISNFQEIAPAPAHGSVAVLTPQGAVLAPVDRRTVVLFIEPFHLHPAPTERFFNELKQLLTSTIRRGDAAAVVSWRHVMKVRQDFTDDVSLLSRALDSIHSEFDNVAPDAESDRLNRLFLEELREEAAIQQQTSLTPSTVLSGHEQARQALLDIRRKSAALKRLVNSMSAAQGKRVLVMATRRFSQYAGAEFFGGDVPFQERDYFNTFDIREDFTRSANAAGVTIYAIYPEAVEPMSFANAEERQRRDIVIVGERTGQRRGVRKDGDRPIEDAMKLSMDGMVVMNETAAIGELATRTGGVAAWGPTDIVRLVETVKEDLSSYYSMAYRTRGGGESGPRRVSVTAKDRRYEVRTRREHIIKTDSMRMHDRVLTALYAKVPDTALLFDAAAGKMTKRRRAYRVPLRVAVPVKALTTTPSPEGERGSFTVFVVAGGMLGVMSDVAERTQSFVIDAARAASAEGAVITHEIEVETDALADRLAIGVLDETSREYGVMTISLGSRRKADGS